MKRFLRGRSFRVMVIVVALLLSVSITVGIIKTQSPQSSILGTLLTPIQEFAASTGESVTDFFDTFTKYDALKAENESLREQLHQLQQEKIEWQEDVTENQFYKQFYDIQEDNPDYKMTSAKVISRDTTDAYGSFTINIGSLDGISKNAPVITSDGLVGLVSTVSPTYATVTTVLSPDCKVGVNDARTSDTGIVSGSADVALQGRTKMNHISRSGSVAEGDYVITSGSGGVFPKGLLVGTVKSLAQDQNEDTLHAEIVPAADVLGCTNVMVITAFEGQMSMEDLQ